ncbi:universal stress protein yxie [Plakobranchus ocellatus]|uniref:Universal stress protein yxie n=1 Tax=Plakobranchus ocellatus TaxID=259542 RepID=A0AAV4DIK4_9GAST|nr:universal stress protein yxie [Plakobranchus ocellatus]
MDGSANANLAFDFDQNVPSYIRIVDPAVVNTQERAVDTLEILHRKLVHAKVNAEAVSLRGCVHRLAAANAGYALVQEAEREGVSMIVIGSRGHGTLRRTLLGSVSTFVLYHSTVPVLIHPPKKL